MADDPRVLVLTEMRKQTALLAQILAALGTPAAASAPSVDLDDPHGDPTVKAKDPRDWTGEPMKGRTFSACPPEYLDLLADRMDFFVRKDTDRLNDIGQDGDTAEIAKLEKSIKYGTLDAARARAWAARKRSGWTAPEAARVDETQTEPRW